MPDRPTTGTLEQRSLPEAPAPTIDGRRLRGVIPYGVESRDLGGWREIMERGSLAGARTEDLVATVDHAGVPLARFPTTLEVEDRDDGLHWSLELPESRADVREAVERGDLRSTSWRMIVGRDRWAGARRHVEEVRELRDVAIVTNGAYAEARAEYRAAPDPPPAAPAPQQQTPPPPEQQEEATVPETNPGGGLSVEDRAADPPSIESRVMDAIASVRKGESRSLTTTSAEAIAPPELSTFLWDRLRPASIALASGIRVITTERESVKWPRIVADVDPTWTPEGDQIPAGDPGIGELEAKPRKLAHRVEVTNEILDDSEPSAVDVLNGHLATMLALKLDRAIYTGNPGADAESIRGLKFLAGIQSIDMGVNGAALEDLDPFVQAVGLLMAANVPPPYVAAMHPRVWTELGLLKEQVDSVKPLLADPPTEAAPPRVAGTAAFASSQLPVNEQKGTEVDATSVYVYAPAEVVLVRRQDATIELDRSRLFDRDMSELRGKLRADLIVPNPQAVVRIEGVIPPAAAA